jgi:hypothetical protein
MGCCLNSKLEPNNQLTFTNKVYDYRSGTQSNTQSERGNKMQNKNNKMNISNLTRTNDNAKSDRPFTLGLETEGGLNPKSSSRMNSNYYLTLNPENNENVEQMNNENDASIKKTNKSISITNNITNIFVRSNDKNLESFKSSQFDIPRLKELKLPNVQIPDYIINSRNKLVLKVLETKFLDPNLKIVINAGGLEGSERMAKDGVVLFGNKSKISDITAKSKISETFLIPNDFNFPDEELLGEKHFQIKFDLDNDKYWIKDLFGSGLFIKLTFPAVLKNNSIFSFVSCQILVTLSLGLNTSKDDYIKLKILYGINKGEEYFFQANENPCIYFGRSISKQRFYVTIPDENISRIQCMIYYKDGNWLLIDGDGVVNSTNGTWFLADDFFEIEEGLIFRAGKNSFVCSFDEPRNAQNENNNVVDSAINNDITNNFVNEADLSDI